MSEAKSGIMSQRRATG